MLVCKQRDNPKLIFAVRILNKWDISKSTQQNIILFIDEYLKINGTEMKTRKASMIEMNTPREREREKKGGGRV